MKFFLQIALLLAPLTRNSLVDVPLCKLTIVPGDCRLNQNYFPGQMRVSIYGYPTDTLIMTADCNIRHSKIECNLPPARYKIRYNNNFGQAMTKWIDLSPGSQRVDLCADSLDSYSHNVLPKLKEGQLLVIAYTSSGCFHYMIRRLVIKKEDANLVASLFDDHGYDPEKKKPLPKNFLRARKQLTPADIAAFNRFENEIAFVRDGMCTTTDTYSIQSDYWSMTRKDEGCSWNGFYYLTKALFGKEL